MAKLIAEKDGYSLSLDVEYYNILDIECFSRMMKNPSYCYKFYWLEAIVQLISQGVKETTFDAVIDEMISNAWYSVREFHIHLSGIQMDGQVRDGLERAVLKLSELSNLPANASKIEIKNAIVQYAVDLKRFKEQVTTMVPYRALAGFFDKVGVGVDWGSSRKLVSSIEEINKEVMPLPYTLGKSSKLKMEIYFQPSWIQMIQDNTVSILGWIQYEKVKWLQNNNPEVPGLVYKLTPMDEKMRKLNHVRKLWEGVLELSEIRDVFTGNPVIHKKYDVDHFIPWSFVMNDELWNLMPMDSSLNSSKSNKLPKWDPFFEKFANNQYLLYELIHGLHDKVDYIELFKDIYAALHTDEFPAVLTVPSKERQDGKYRDQTLESVVAGIKEKADHIYSTYSLQFKHRTLGELSDAYQNYLFQDHQFHSILNANNSYITMHSDTGQKINSIGFSQKKPERAKNNIQTMLGQLRGFITYFQGAVNILAINYMQCKKEKRKEGEDAFTMESSIRSVLALFRLNDASIDYLTTQIMMTSHKIKGKIQPAEFDLSFYENGFRYYAFENNTEHDMQSQIMMYSFQNTPEKTLLRYCEKAKVIGISATATVSSVIGNYDIDYLKDKMQEVFIETTPEEKQGLIDTFNESQKGYQNVNIHAELLGCKGTYSLEAWLSVFDDKELAEAIYGKIQRLYGEGEDKNDYFKKRYLRIGLAFKQFVTHEDIHSFLCVLNKHPRPKDRDLDRDVLFDIFAYIAADKKWNGYDKRKTVVFLDGSEYEDKKTNLIERLAAGEKLFVISVYQTIGAGQNLQYPVPGALADSVVKINDRTLKNEKDFDAIYLDKPTNLIVPLSDNMEENEFVKYLFQMEFLQETSELSSYDTLLNIKKAFRTFMMGHRNDDGFANIYQKKSVMLLSTRYIIQAIGRICRTNQKNRNIYVYADDSIADCLDVSVVEGRTFNPEFIALVDAVKQQGIKTPEIMSLEDSASLRAVRVNKEIKNMLNNDWTEANIKKWKALRGLVLMRPTISAAEAKKNFIIRNFYVQLPEPANTYFYYQHEDYNSVSISFDRDKNHIMKVSEEGTKLQHMLRIPGVKELFQQNGYATSFEVNDYIMTPPLWNNIYKGALGEVVGKFLLERNLKIVIKEIEDPALFELFDFEVAGSSVYIDFKNWQEGVTEDKNAVIRKIADKAKKCGCKCVVVANIYAEGEWSISDTELDGIRIISLPCLVKSTGGKLYYDKDAWDILRGVY